MNTETPKSLILIFLGLGIILLIIIFPIWLGDDPDDPIMISDVDYQTAYTPSIVDLQEEQKVVVKNNRPVIQNTRSVKEVRKQAIKKSIDSVAENFKTAIDTKDQQVVNVERLTDNIQSKAGSFLSENRNNASDLSLEEKTSIADTVAVFSERTVNRIEKFLSSRH